MKVVAERPAPNSAWWVYFVLLCGLSLVSLLAGPSSPLDFALSIVNLFALVGLWGYIRQVAVGWPHFWAGYFCLSVLLHAVSLLLMLIGPDVSLGLAVALGFSSAVLLPLFVALWRYAFQSSAVWAHGNA